MKKAITILADGEVQQPLSARWIVKRDPSPSHALRHPPFRSRNQLGIGCNACPPEVEAVCIPASADGRIARNEFIPVKTTGTLQEAADVVGQG